MSAHDRMIDRKVAAAVVAAVLAIAPAACKQAEAVETQHYQPSKITPAKDGSGHPTVTLTKLGADRIGLTTAPVEKATKKLKTIPYAAVLYDGVDGQPYVFVGGEGLSFHRVDVTIENVGGDEVDISGGPPVGVQVVTVGIAQIHGAELEYGAY